MAQPKDYRTIASSTRQLQLQLGVGRPVLGVARMYRFLVKSARLWLHCLLVTAIWANAASAQSLTEIGATPAATWYPGNNDAGAGPSYDGNDNLITFASAEQACQISIAASAARRIEVFGPDTDVPTYVSTDPARYMFEWNTREWDQDRNEWIPLLTRTCNDHMTGDLVLAYCPDGYSVAQNGIDAKCVRVNEPGECEACKAGASPLAGGPLPTVGNPISVDSGAKVQGESDYATADGLLAVRRSYRSKQRDVASGRLNAEVAGFGRSWHGVVPGRISASGEQFARLSFLSADGTANQFLADPAVPSAWQFTSPDATRLKVSVVAAAPGDRVTFFRDGAAPADSAPDLRLDFANGDYLLFRRAGDYDPNDTSRALVPVEQGFANGYHLNFDYNDNSQYPYRVRDSFGRQLSLTWGDADWTGSGSQPPRERLLTEITLPDTTKLIYQYGTPAGGGWRDRLDGVQRRDQAGQVLWGRGYLYEDAANPQGLTGITDQAGARLSSYSYNAAGLAASTEQAGGVNRWTIGYFLDPTNPRHEVRKVTNPLGREEDYTFELPSAAGTNSPRKLKRVDGMATSNLPADSKSYEYRSNAQPNAVDADMLVSATNALGYQSRQSVDPVNKRPVSDSDPFGNTWQIEWSPQFDLPVKQTLPGKLSIQTQYDSNGQILSRSQIDQTPGNFGAARTSAYTWAPGGRLLTLNGPRDPALHGGQDDITSFTYDAQGNRLTMTNPLGHVTSYANYDANGNPGEMTDPNGVKTVFTYDSLGRVKSVTVKHPVDPALDATTSFDYDIEGRVVGLTLPDTAKLIFDYDLAGRLLSTRSEDGERIDYTYDAMSNVLTETVKRADGTQSRGVSRTYDELGRMLSEVLGPGRETRWAYDANGNATQITSPRGTVTSNAFDALDRLIETIAPAAGTVTTDYDSQSNPSRFTDANQVATQFTRNGFGDVVQEVSPDRGTTSYTYDEAGDVKSITDGRSMTVAYQRDILGRIVLKTPSDNAANAVRYDWDLPDTETTWRIGRLTRIKDATGWTVFNYDHRGNLTSQRQKLIGTADWVYLRYSYDLADRIRTVTYPSGRQVLYARDDKGRVLSVKTRLSSTVPTWTILASGMTYEPFGPVKAMHLGNGLRAVNDWGDDGRLASRRLYRLSDGTNLSRLTYGYDADDNIVRITDTLDAGKTQKFAYDEAGRVSRVDVASGPVQRITYVNDNNGNRLRQVNRALPTDTAPLSTDTYSYTAGTNRLASVKTGTGAAAPTRTIQYDARGNTAAETRPGGVGVTTAYDGYGRLTQYTRSTEALSFQYNGRDDRVAMASASAGVRRYVYDPAGRVIGEYGLSAADVKAEFIWLSPEATNDNAFGGDDGIGGYAPLAVATPDSSGTVQLNWVHPSHLGVPLVTTDASGNPATTPSDYLAPGFPGQARVLADLYYNRYRDYDPTTGRYIQADPIGLAGGGNPYLYAGGNPVTGMDPMGLNPAIAYEGAVLVGEVTGDVLVLLCRRYPAKCMATIGGAAIAVANFFRGPPKDPPIPPAIPRGPSCDSGDDCEAEWAEAFRICRAELSKPNPNPSMTGGHRDVMSCARGFVSERCGGNRVERNFNPSQPFTRRRRW